MRRGSLIAIIALLLMITAAAAWQLKLAGEHRTPYPGPVTPGAAP